MSLWMKRIIATLTLMFALIRLQVDAWWLVLPSACASLLSLSPKPGSFWWRLASSTCLLAVSFLTYFVLTISWTVPVAMDVAVVVPCSVSSLLIVSSRLSHRHSYPQFLFFYLIAAYSLLALLVVSFQYHVPLVTE